jgi:tRNA A37 methylthiotransferase MiaB
MGRPYGDLDRLIGRLYDFRQKYPYAGLGGDFIAGHPGETDAMFEDTLRAVSGIGFTYGHVFRFSRREGAPSAVMSDQVSEAVKKYRGGALRDLLQDCRKKFLSRLSARILYIIVESEYPVRGVSGNYIKIEVPGLRVPKNTWARVVLSGAACGGYCIADVYDKQRTIG